MADFTLDSSTLQGGQYRTAPVPDMYGKFQDIQFHFSQSVSGQDMEIHYMEFHFELAGPITDTL